MAANTECRKVHAPIWPSIHPNGPSRLTWWWRPAKSASDHAPKMARGPRDIESIAAAILFLCYPHPLSVSPPALAPIAPTPAA
ncbi:hypothetical protein TRIATDRAFT_260443 [Trichoderma atroviride IMI 206040]|uniref:Uncharacterized protein n=1 Tax=Hypocrea atroviridis (strain ATCC 20476 / IMI 206040) TaxID=452589 RepID=G9PBU9_HYPAI|nr:uncharacterized protein TRIATDRAFT_260443 [Trichoderma atroviride IMI 206040]EHK39843.1 hypothetical protein TRIATDRAFT_260443 [Trichoderma atroviride IMI 206040]